MIIEARAYARAGLLGNPSDGYFGKTISISVKNFGAAVTLFESPELHIKRDPREIDEYVNIHQLIDSIDRHGYYGAERLIKAAIKKFAMYCREQGITLPNRNFTIRHTSNIPRQVGLAGSSAIITATFRALQKFYQIDIPKEILPTLILKSETEELGINAGLQDRVIQVYEGCVFMDFDEEYLRENDRGKYTPIKPELFRNVYIAYKTELSKVSGRVLNDIRLRYEKGENEVIAALKAIAECAEAGKTAIEAQDHEKLNALINRNFDLRSRIMNISDSNRNMIATARNCGASAKFAGSGGSIIGIYRDDEMLSDLIREMKKINARVIKPYMV